MGKCSGNSSDDFSGRSVLRTVAPLFPRNYVVMELRGNLIKAEREQMLKRFQGSQFKRIARVAMGKPPKAWTDAYHADLLKEKQSKIDAEWKKNKAERERKQKVAQRQKDLAAARAKREAELKKRKEEIARKAEAAKKAEEEP